MNKVLISVVGPTGIGKTRLGIVLANHFNTEILSSDSRQFYKEMSIGTAVPSTVELAAAHHHFIQHKSIHDNYSVGDFERDALKKLDELFEVKDIVIMVGGSGLYVNAVTDGLNEFPEVDSCIREKLNVELATLGIGALQIKLKKLDPNYYTKVDIQNPHRLIRALEICIGADKPYSSFLEKPKSKRNFKVLTIGLGAGREIVYERINQRVDLMMQEGLLEEVRSLIDYKELNALQTVGYKEIFQYLDNNWTKEFAISEIKKNTRRFAKRQNTWFKKNKETLWINHDYEKNRLLTMVEKATLELKNE